MGAEASAAREGPRGPAAARLRRRGPVVLVLLAAIAAGLAAWSRLLAAVTDSSTHTATATLILARRPPRFLDAPARDDREDDEAFRRNQVALIRSRPILESALRQPEMRGVTTLRDRDDPVGWLAEHLRVGFQGETDLLDVSLSGKDRKDLALTVNAVVDSYQKRVAGEEERARVDRHETLKRLWAKYQDDIRARRSQLRQLATDPGRMRESERASPGEEIALIRRQLARLKVARIKAEARLSARTADKADASDPATTALKEKVATLKAQVEALTKEQDRLLDARKRTPVGTMDLKTEEDEIAVLAQMARRLGEEVERLEVEQHAPKRIRILSLAQPSP